LQDLTIKYRAGKANANAKLLSGRVGATSAAEAKRA
jgi:hypothetical protein